MGQAVSSSSLAVVCTREVRCQCLMSEVAESAADSVETVVPLLVSNAQQQYLVASEDVRTDSRKVGRHVRAASN